MIAAYPDFAQDDKISVTKVEMHQSSISKGVITRRKYKNMKQTLTIIAAIAVGAFSFLQAQPPGGPHGGWHLNPLEEMSSTLNLTDAQKAKVQPILDQARPQLRSIHEEAMTKAKAVIDASLTQIRPLLTPEQQTKLDAIVKAHEDMHSAMKELHDAKAK
jgi:Spy/CpxP family protein refolding chaperone